ncbi:magnesium transporter [Methyloligella sp. 2.7D]|uniref:magnesium transporter n=1 Tax=unclassified Methyloligella TaxID=2625955 RepID=UPI00157D9F9D|nr:magnesium transporter [Methyloligella sp. GL2]QKP76315.1 magnesium transporter [Methyloligella sp. GL2]
MTANSFDTSDPRDLDPAALAADLAKEHPADIAERLNGMPWKMAASVLRALPVERAAEVLDEPWLDNAVKLVNAQPDRAAALLQDMAADRRADVFRELDAATRKRLLAAVDTETRDSLQQLLSYPEETAGSLMTTEFVSVPADWTVAETLEHIRKVERAQETIYAIYVLDPVTKALVKSVPLRRLISGAPDAPVASVMPRRPISVAPLADREDVARLISKYDLLAVPVLDAAGHVLGIVTVDDIIDAMVEETTEDVQKFGGVEAFDEPYMALPFLGMLKKRAGWLCALFIGEMLTASAMQNFEMELEQAVVLTLFIPLIMSSGGNSGSQATSLIIRALALQEVRIRDWWRVALRELPTGLALGSILGALGIARIALWQVTGIFDYGPYWVLVAATVGATLVAIVTFGSLTGSMLPFILKRIGFDPASASAPFVATLVDVTGLVIYFTIALVILSGTLL